MAGEKRQITRHRTSYSCRNCRQRKIKCGKERPICSACQKTDEECVYIAGNADKFEGQSIQATALPSRKRKQDVQHGVDSEQGPVPGPAGLDNLKKRIAELDRILKELNTISTRTHVIDDGPQHDEQDRITGQNTQELEPAHEFRRVLSSDASAQPGSMGNNSLFSKSRSQQHNLTSFENTEHLNFSAISSQLEQIISLLRNQAGIPLATSSPGIDNRGGRSSKEVYGADRNVELTSEYSLVADQNQSNVLFRNWLTSVYPVLPIVDPTEVLAKYDAFHSWYPEGFDKGYANPVKSFMPLIHAIYYGGMLGTSMRGLLRWWPGMSRRSILSVFHVQYQLSIENVEEQSVETIAAMIMMQRMCNETDHSYGPSKFLLPILRTAQGQGLQRQSPKWVSPVSAELRHRLWWEVVNLDTSLATSSNIPPLLHRGYFNAPLPNDIKLCKIGGDSAREYENSVKHEQLQPDHADDPDRLDFTSMISVHGLVYRARAMVSEATRKLLEIYFAARPLTKEDMVDIRHTLSTIEGDVRSMIDRIPYNGTPEFESEPPTYKEGQSMAMDNALVYSQPVTQVDINHLTGKSLSLGMQHVPVSYHMKAATVAFHKWSRIALSMLIDQTLCLSYAPFLRNSKSKLWTMARQCALKHSHSYLRKYNVLALDLELERFRWTWSSLFQPMHATTLLLLDLFDRPYSLEASRSRALIDQMLSLTDPGRGIIGGDFGLSGTHPLEGRDSGAATLFEQLRIKAWQKALLDPGLLWSEQDQIQVGAGKPPSELERLTRSIREDTKYNNVRVDTPGQSSAMVSLLQNVVGTAAGELRHPSQAGPPPDAEYHQPSPPVTANTEQPEPAPRLLRARDDQQRLPVYGKRGWYHIPAEVANGLQEVDALIGRIRSSKVAEPKTHDHEKPIVAQQNDYPKVTMNGWQHNLLPAPSSQNMNGCNYTEQKQMMQVALEELSQRDWYKCTDPQAILTPASTINHDLDTNCPGQAPSQAHTMMGQSEVADHTADFAHDPPLALDFEFDWNQWDAVFGQVEDGSLDNLMNMDIDTIAGAFSDR